ncbi:phage baseplate assembly protein V [Micromonospora sp. BQ11]|uniref:phage baseplate assembly protein V n=1 Tax=Micromonospora sp. BQ11 TaxID=3452212 RepID=UPI003F8C8D5A
MTTTAKATGKKYYGKYRATVVNNVDPMQIGRLQVIVPDVSHVVPTSWAMPCVPISGINNGTFALPLMGAGVWVEFEQGNPDHPIWVGGYWGNPAETPALAKAVPPGVPGITLQTATLNGVVINDTPGVGGVTIFCRGVPMIAVTDAGISVTNGKGAMITLVGPAVSIVGTPVDVNAGGLTVM